MSKVAQVTTGFLIQFHDEVEIKEMINLINEHMHSFSHPLMEAFQLREISIPNVQQVESGQYPPEQVSGVC